MDATPNLPLGTISGALSPEPLALADGVSNHDMASEVLDWLSFHRVWGQLDHAALMACAQALRLLKLTTGTEIYREGQSANGLYLLKWGSVEVYRTSAIGKTHIMYRTAGEIFGYAPLFSAAGVTPGIPNQSIVYQASTIAVSASEIWFLPREAFDQLRQDFPLIERLINQLLVQDVRHFTQRIAQEQIRIQGLQTWIRPIPKNIHPIGESQASQKLMQQLQQAAQDVKPIILQAAIGTGKTFLAGYLHQQSGLRDRPFSEIDCTQLPRDSTGQVNSDLIFGLEGGRLGVIELLERGTLLLDQVHVLSVRDRDRLRDYLSSSHFTRNIDPASDVNAGSHSPPPSVTSWVRLILASPSKLDIPGVEAHRIKLFSLAQRKSDIPALAKAFVARFCQIQGRSPLQLSQADIRRLVSYHYPGNLPELAGILQRAVIMTPMGQTIIPEQVLWSLQSAKNAFRIDLLEQLPWLRRFLLSRWWPERFWTVIMAIFVPVTVMGYIGPQTRDASMTLNFFWAWWWPLYLFLFVFVGRLWCAVCPFMIAGEWLRKISLWIWPRQLLPWPTKWLNRWGAWLLFGGFLLIYLWEKLWDLPHTPYLSSWLLVVIAAGAVICSVIYERRLWCRYLCPIGGMNGMFAKLSMVELRSTQQVCGSQCSTFGCYKGSDATPVVFADALTTEGQATAGCPLYSHPAQLTDNRDCVLCMTCLKACPNRSVQLNLRFPATDLLEDHQGFAAEVALLLLLLGGVCMHHSDRILAWLGWADVAIDSDHLLIGLPVVSGLLSLPLLLTYAAHQLTRLGDRQMPDYLTVIYAYLPLTLAANLAHYTPVAMTEAGQILPVMARTFGYSGAIWPTITWSMDVAQFLQGVVLLSGFGFSVYPLLRITQRSWLNNLPHLLCLAGLTFGFFKLMI